MKSTIINERCKCTHFDSAEGASEFFFVFDSNDEKTFTQELVQMNSDIALALSQFGLSADTTVFARFYLSDIANQRDELMRSDIFSECCRGAHAVVQQAPLDAGKITLLLYHIKGESIKCEPISSFDGEWSNALKVSGKNYDHYWTGNYTSDIEFDSYKQTTEIFKDYNDFLTENNMTLFDNALRTWIYVRDIDNHYAGMVESRKEYFEQHGLNKDTHYIASTGIEARLKEVDTLVSMDALAIDGIKPEQIVQMEALEHLNPTHEYGVTFERGTKITFGDREHFHISGTASIDKFGDVVHTGDVDKQTLRTLENIRALLNPHGADLDDMAYLIVYLRNHTHIKSVTDILREEIGHDTPLVVVQGAVCRPTWLIEMEGVAIKEKSTNYPVFS